MSCLRVSFVVLLMWGGMGCSPPREEEKPETCAPPGWNEAAVRDALAAHLESTTPRAAFRPMDLEVRALVWDEGMLPHTLQSAGADSAGSAGHKALVWAQGKKQGHLALLDQVAPSEGGQLRLRHVRTFGHPIRSADLEPFLREFEPQWERWLPGARAIRPVALRGVSHRISATLCSSALQEMLGSVEEPGGEDSDYYDQGWMYEYLVDPVERGHYLYTAMACNTCHSTDGSHQGGPSLAGLLGMPRPLLPDGEPVEADAAYLAHSIRHPADELLCGYPAIMPAYPNLSDRDVAALSAFIGSSPEPATRTDHSAVSPCTARALPAGESTSL